MSFFVKRRLRRPFNPRPSPRVHLDSGIGGSTARGAPESHLLRQASAHCPRARATSRGAAVAKGLAAANTALVTRVKSRYPACDSQLVSSIPAYAESARSQDAPALQPRQGPISCCHDGGRTRRTRKEYSIERSAQRCVHRPQETHHVVIVGQNGNLGSAPALRSDGFKTGLRLMEQCRLSQIQTHNRSIDQCIVDESSRFPQRAACPQAAAGKSPPCAFA